MNNTETKTESRIYIACLAAYNNGLLHGKWVNLRGLTEDDVHTEIKSILDSSPVPGAEEWAIHDYEGFGSYDVSEYEDISTLIELVNALDEHGEIILGLHGYLGNKSITDTIEYHEDNYRGEFDSYYDLGYEYLAETCGLEGVPEHLQYYIDFEKYGQDLAMDFIEIGCHYWFNN